MLETTNLGASDRGHHTKAVQQVLTKQLLLHQCENNLVPKIAACRDRTYWAKGRFREENLAKFRIPWPIYGS